MPATGNVEAGAVLEVEGHGRPDLEIEVGGRILVDEDPAVDEALPASILQPDVDQLLEGGGVGDAELLVVVADLDALDPDAGGGADLRNLSQRRRRRPRGAAGISCPA